MIDTPLPPYTVRRSKRAKHVGLCIKQQQLEIVVPERAAMPDVESLLRQHEDWIRKQFAKLPKQTHVSVEPPTQIDLPLLSETWQVEYKDTGGSRTSAYVSGPNTLTVYGVLNNAAIARVLLNWLKRRAKVVLKEKLDACAEETALSYSSLSIRAQKTRWGSCSPDKSINLNVKLLFLPELVVRYILIHELCHTVHLNHGRHFWKLVSQFVPDYRSHVQRLKRLEASLPGWIGF